MPVPSVAGIGVSTHNNRKIIMILISVKYHGPTNHRGSRWIATMSDCEGGNLASTEPFAYGESDGSEEAALKVLTKWDDRAEFTARVSAGNWVTTRIGETHDHVLIFTAVFKYEGES